MAILLRDVIKCERYYSIEVFTFLVFWPNLCIGMHLFVCETLGKMYQSKSCSNKISFDWLLSEQSIHKIHALFRKIASLEAVIAVLTYFFFFCFSAMAP